MDGEDKGGVIWNLVSNKCYFWSILDFDSQFTSDRHDLVLLGKYAQLTFVYFRPKRTLKPNYFRRDSPPSLARNTSLTKADTRMGRTPYIANNMSNILE